jgi:hypothetical protein
VSGEMSPPSPEHGWALLRTDPAGQAALGLRNLSAGVRTARGAVRFALGPAGEPRLLIPLPPEVASPGIEGSASLGISASQYDVDGRATRFLDIQCRSESLESVFADLAEAILSRIGLGDDGVSATRSTIEEFRSLLLPDQLAAVAPSRVAGLAGELLMLERFLRSSPSAVLAWRGPIGDRHDFRRGGDSLEIKTSTRAGASSVTIHSLDQLDPPNDGRLHLLHLVLEPLQGGQISVGALAKACHILTDHPEVLAERLAAVGCPSPDSDAWNHLTFRRESEALYEVALGFPRLSRSFLSSVPGIEGIRSVEYSVDLGSAATFLRGDDHWTELMDRMTK